MMQCLVTRNEGLVERGREKGELKKRGEGEKDERREGEGEYAELKNEGGRVSGRREKV